jgi:predicted aspartyl protease
VGTFFHPITVTGPTGASETVEALVDTGASFSTIPAPIVERLGVSALDKVRLRLATGQVITRDIGAVTAELDGLAGRPVICVFGDPDAPPAIGAQTLESFLFGVDPDGKRLVPVEGWWA